MSSPDLVFQTWLAPALVDAIASSVDFGAAVYVDGVKYTDGTKYNFTESELTAAVTAHPLPDRSFPYVDLGQSELSDHVGGHEIRVTLHLWDEAEGPHKVKQLQHVVRTLAHGLTFTEGAWRFTCVREEYSNVILDRSEEHWHGIMRIRVLASAT